MKEYYVYAIIINEKYVYVGKGKDDRKDHHLKNFLTYNTAVNKLLKDKLANATKLKHNIDVSVLHDGLTEQHALDIETQLINQHGKKIDGSGTLCNVCDGGGQPPNATQLRQMFGDEKFKQIKKQQSATCQDTLYKKYLPKLKIIEKMLKENIMIKDIALEIQVNKDTVLRWIKKYNIPGYDGAGKKIRIQEHLQTQRTRRKKEYKPPKTAKLYTIQEPCGNIITTRTLKQYCSNKNIDYSNLRSTYKKNSFCKGYTILKQVEPKDID